MNVKEMVTAKLRELGADGLCNDECGCEIDGLMPCAGQWGGPNDNCMAAKRVACSACPESQKCGDFGVGSCCCFRPMEAKP